MKQFKATLIPTAGRLDAILYRADGSEVNLGCLNDDFVPLGYPVQWLRSLWRKLRNSGIIPMTLAFAAFVSQYGVVDQPHRMRELLKDQRVVDIIMAPGGPDGRFGSEGGLVVTGGANYLATDFSSGGASPRISAMNFHDSGIGTVAATSTDSGLGTQAGPATRATGTQSNPATNSYRSVGTIAYTGTLAITEWGLFSASTSGTMWDRRVFSAINVVNGDSIQFTYTLTINAGGT
jgi:hypothetical protein